jgi:pyruvate dehydrogenase E1 component alpha subunit
MIEKYDPLKGKTLKILHPDGKCDEAIKPDLNDETVFELYKKMVFLRLADQKALALQRQGRMGTYAPYEGQEAAQVGSAAALGEKDWVFPSFREMAVYYIRGVPLKYIFAYWMGHELGQQFPEGTNILPVSIPVGTHPLHAVGAAWAAKLRGERICTIAYFGDGGTSEGDFHEAMNFAGVFQTPTIFFCQNNQYAISVPRKQQSASKTLAQKAIAYGFEGIQVDGNDLFAVFSATKEARDKAVAGGGPTMIEAVTFRFGPHTTADDPTKYRDDAEVEAWRPLDPLTRLQKYFQSRERLDEDLETEIRAEAASMVNQVVEEAEGFGEPGAEDIFRYTFEDLTPSLQEQMEDYLSFLRETRE